MTDDPLMLDTRGSLCPQPIIDLARRMKELPIGSVLTLISDDAAFPLDLSAWCAGNRQDLLGIDTEGRVHTARIQKIR